MSASAAHADMFDVSTTDPTGPGSLSKAIQDGNAVVGPHTITFSVTGTIDLNNALPAMTEDFDIQGPGADQLTVADPAGGGAFRIFEITGTMVAISGMTISGGTAAEGAAIFNNGGVLTVDACVIDGNTAEGANGGGGIFSNGGSLTVSDSTISNNVATATAAGGGIRALNTTNCQISGTTFVGNSAPAGGAFALGENGVMAELINCTLSGNTSTGAAGGGAAIVTGTTATNTLTLTNCTVAGNLATGGGPAGLLANYIGGDGTGVVYSNTILANAASADNVGVSGASATATSGGHNLADDASANLVATGDQPDTDPLLSALADNGGPTPTHALKDASPAIDAGDPASTLVLDQRGNVRPIDGDAGGTAENDIGAFEHQLANLEVVKSVNTATPTAGANLEYQLDVQNMGGDAAEAVMLADTLPVGVTFVSASDGGMEAAGVVTWDLGDMAAGASLMRTVTVMVDSSVTGMITNAAAVTSTTPDTDGTDDTDMIDTAIATEADMGLTKTTTTAMPIAGNLLQWELVATNNGPSDALMVQVVDTLPAGVVFNSADMGGMHAAGVVTWDLGPITAGDSVTLTLEADVDSSTLGLITNSATVSATTTDNNAGNDTAMEDTTIDAVADLAIDKTSPATATAGNNLTYTIDLTSNGPSDAADVVITDTLPAGVTFVSATNGGVEAAGVVTWNLGAVADGATPQVQVTVNVNADTTGTLTNNANVTATTTDNVSGNDSDMVDTPVSTEADLSVTKTDSVDPVLAGNNLTYTITVSNAGPSNAANVVAMDTLPAGVTFVSATNGGTEAGGAVTWNLGTLALGGMTSVMVTVTVDSSTTANLNNTVTVSTDADDANSANDTANEATTVNTEIDLSVTKTDAVDPVASGTPLVYTINVANAGPSDATDVVVTDMLPAGVAFDSASDGGMETMPGIVTWNLPTLAAGANIDLTLTVAIGTGVTGLVTNNVSVSANETDSDATNDSASEDTDTLILTDLEIVKTGPASPFTAGNNLTYNITVTNHGPSDAPSAAIVDVLPPQLLTPTWSCTPMGGAVCPAIVGPNLNELVNLPAGASLELAVTGFIDGNTFGNISNTATVTAAPGTGDPMLGNNSSMFDVFVQAPPVAVCQDVVLDSTVTCDVFVTPQEVNNGSSDPEDGMVGLGLALDNEGPFPVGITVVTLTVTDSDGLTDTCTANITVLGADCNGNTVPDSCDIDPTDPDMNGNTSGDCNLNRIPDECDIDAGDPDGDGRVSEDVRDAGAGGSDGIPDECQSDILFVDANAGGSAFGTRWDDAFAELADATRVAGNPANAVTEIRVADGTYKPDAGSGDRDATYQMQSGLEILGGYPGAGAANPDARDPAAFLSILSGEIGNLAVPADNSLKIVRADGVDNTAVLDGFAIRDGFADAGGQEFGGAGIFMINASPQLRNLRFASNRTTSSGGAMVNLGGAPTVSDSSFTTNMAVRLGGALFVRDGLVRFTNCDFNNNGAGDNGGAIHLEAGELRFTDSAIHSNNATVSGGGIASLGGTLVLKRTDVYLNNAPTGGGLSLPGGIITIANSRIYANTAAADGGAFMIGANATTALVSIVNSLVYDNVAMGGVGGAVHVVGDGRPTIINSTLHANTALTGAGGIEAASGITRVVNTILWQNETNAVINEAAQARATGGSLSIGHSCIEGLGMPASGNIGDDPLFTDAPAKDFSLGGASPAIDIGDNTALPADTADVDNDNDTAEPLPIDFGGDFRRAQVFLDRSGVGVLPFVDMGAFEFSIDCDMNGVDDAVEILNDPSLDCNNNGVLDACEPDCNGNGVPDDCDIDPADPDGDGVSSADCNANGVPDECDTDPADPDGNGLTSADCDNNNVPDECQPDGDGDGTIDACDGCPADAAKQAPGLCGCNVADGDSDGDGVPNCDDQCPSFDDNLDSDGDGEPDCTDLCPSDPDKVAPGICGCGVSDADTDADGTPDCFDNCPDDAGAQTDTDGDGIGDVCDICPDDIDPDQLDSDGDGLGNACDPTPFPPNPDNPGDIGNPFEGLNEKGDDIFDLPPNTPSVPAPVGPGAGEEGPEDDQSNQDPPSTTDDMAPVSCGAGCGMAGIPMVPLLILGMAGMKWRHRRRFGA
jgi:uncharacterized repeat protein (TIGR01451 family)